MILDVTAGNRRMYQEKSFKEIVYLDCEKKLEFKPLIFASNEKLPFKEKTFSSVFYDPPYYWLQGTSFYGIPDKETWHKIHPQDNRKIPVYYGVDKIKSRSHLFAHLYRALEDIKRVLKDDGLLWFKWCDIGVSLKKILVLFKDWIFLLKFEIGDKNQTGWNNDKKQTYWCCFGKNESSQKTLFI